MRRAAILLVLVAAGCGGSEQGAAKRTCDPSPGAVEAADLASSGTATMRSPATGCSLKPRICTGTDGPAVTICLPASSVMRRILAHTSPDTR